jgi:hypothetical protein
MLAEGCLHRAGQCLQRHVLLLDPGLASRRRTEQLLQPTVSRMCACVMVCCVCVFFCVCTCVFVFVCVRVFF